MDLAEYLQTAYGNRTHADRLNRAQATAKIDDETATDRGHCQIQVLTTGPGTFELQLASCPMTSELREFVKSHTGTIATFGTGNEIKLKLSVRQITVIRQLARIIRSTVGRGRRYTDRNWKWICPRTADSLDRFAAGLRQSRGAPGIAKSRDE